MAFAGYDVTRRNMYNHKTCDCSGVWWNMREAMNAVKIFKDENKVGDCISVIELDTEDNPTDVMFTYLDPTTYEWKEI